MSNRHVFNISFGKVNADAPKHLKHLRGKWFWRCDCGCNGLHGPFKTKRAAERDAEKTMLHIAEELDNAAEEIKQGVAIH